MHVVCVCVCVWTRRQFWRGLKSGLFIAGL
jgi:hypothetical protein